METTINHDTAKEDSLYAGFWLRFCAYLIDSIILGIPLSIITMIAFMIFFGTSDVMYMMTYDPALMNQELTDQQVFSLIIAYYVTLLIVSIIGFIAGVAYFAGLHASKWQATIGKKILGLKVTDVSGNRITFWRALGRYAAMAFLSGIFLIGYIIAAFTEKKQSLHDLIAGTMVIKSK